MFSSNTTQESGGYQIQRSLRFNSADSAYLDRTPASAGNRKTWTYSAWVKLSNLASSRVTLLEQYLGNSDTGFLLISVAPDSFSNNIIIEGYNTVFRRTNASYRDYSAWYHVVVAVDTTQATADNRIRLYINGSEVTSFQTTNNLAQNDDTGVNSTGAAYIGQEVIGGQYSNAYMTEINLIDGQALTPSSFGEYNADTGVWQPKRYAGSYGTNGFYLNFSDNSNTTAATLGADYSGNGNNWTPNNFSVSAGNTNDSLVDVPTNWGVDTGVGGTVRGNYCTLNPLSTTSGTYTQGNLRYVGPNTGSYVRSNGTLALTTGKWYWEVTLANAPFSPRDGSSAYNAFGFGVSTTFNSTTSLNSITDAVILQDSGFYKNFSGSVTDGGTAFSSGDVLAVAVDLDANTFTFYRNNTQIATGTIGGTAGRELVPIIISYSSAYGVMDCNFGQRPFAYTAPSGFKALNTQNLPTPTIGATPATQAGKFFNPVLWTGNSTTRAITGVGFQPDFTWLKSRSNALASHFFVDAVRGYGTSAMRTLFSNKTDAEESDNTTGNILFGTIQSLDSDGFTVAAGSTNSYDQTNANGSTYVAWNWKANGAGVTNTAGSITSTVSANTTSGFSVVTFTGGATAGTVGHGLGAAPQMIVVKRRNGTGDWYVYHQAIGNTRTLLLQATNGQLTTTVWNNTSPTSSVFTFLDSSGATYVAYAFSEVPGYSKFGSYTGNGSTDGPFVFTGMRPAWVLVKRSDGADDWHLFDNRRDGFNAINDPLYPNASAAEGSGFVYMDLVSNGFKCRNNSFINNSGVNYIFAAFAEAPQKFALAR